VNGPDVVTMAHGAGGTASRRLVERCLPHLGGTALAELGDAGLVERAAGARVGAAPLVLTTDAFVVRPLRFGGGSIGSLAVHGTLNDLAAAGARPLALTASFVLEEGLELATFEAEVAALGEAARRCDVEVVAADTKVVERGHADGLFIATTGLGAVVARPAPSPRRMAPGDRVLVSGPVADHGIAVLLARGELHLDAEVHSDSASLWPAAEALIEACGPGLRTMRDATRGGVATVLCELAGAAGLEVELDEAAVPLRGPTRGACELLGLDPLYVANEGCLVAVVAAASADAALAALHATEVGREAAVVGEVTAGDRGRVVGRTAFGGRRVLDLLAGDPLPRIC